MNSYHPTLLGMIFLALLGCQSEKTSGPNNEVFTVSLRLPSEPDNLNPMLSKSAYATSIENLILIPLAEFDPFDMQLAPLLIEEVPSSIEVEEGPFKGLKKYDLKIRDEATWGDGKPVNAEDYIFTVKAACNPAVNSPFWRRNMESIQAIETSNTDPKTFSIYTTDENELLGVLAIVNFNIFPKHIYDPRGRMDQFTLETMLNFEKVDSLVQTDVGLQAFGTEFNDVKYNREVVEGAGPYEFEDWVTGEYIVVKKKTDWWGEQVKNAPTMLKAIPDRIEYRIIADENTALTALKDGSIDLVAEVSADLFVEMRDDPNLQEKLNFQTPSIMMYNYLDLNNRDSKLADKAVRKALAYTLDIRAIIENLSHGLSQPTVGPIHPSKNYYNKDLQPISQDLEKSKNILAEAGWVDTNNDGTLDKSLNGTREELILDILVTQKKEGQQIALILKENAAKVGMNINIKTVEGAELLSARRKRDFDIMPIRKRSNPFIYDPSQSWHSESDRPGGGNATGYQNDQVDLLIDQIMDENDASQRTEQYKKLQEILYDDQPVIFLYVPLEKLIVNKRIKIQTSSRRPGYFENLFERAA